MTKPGNALQNIDNYYDELSEGYGFAILPRSTRWNSVNRLGFISTYLIRLGRVLEAIEVAEGYTEYQPKSWQAYESLVKAFEANEDNLQTLQNVKIAVRLVDNKVNKSLLLAYINQGDRVNMLLRLVKSLTLICLMLFLMVLTACNNDSKLDFDAFVEKKLTDFLIEENAQVASIVIVNDKLNYQKQFGEFPDGTKPHHDTVYEIASITKTYTGLLLAKAVVDKKVQLDEDIRVYLQKGDYQNLQHLGKPITLRHLATHRSGLPQDFAYTSADIKSGKAFELFSNYSKAKFFEDLAQYQLTSTPGETFQYSNVGANLTGYILENVYNQPLSTLVAQLITEQSGEEHTRFRLEPSEISKITRGVDRNGKIAPLLSPHSFAEGGLTSTAASIADYMQYLLSTQAEEVLLSRTLLTETSSEHGHAFFWNTYEYHSANPMFYHSGGSMGTSTWLALYPKQKLGIFIATNVSANNTQGKLNDIANAIVEKYEQAKR
ncbi:serine hydrolase [Pseudoalteromonas sp. BMB]|uniref:serine hydrolase domain-containing protein n=1 Tax=Pseudoalteromonas sp. BMB TaxID=1874619 RepID=UPI00083E1F9F|nr:serine hydrolase domain-containing protein [Pseudoalteromonas sp. BMB]ODB44957.1 serine hydrolase [Pseudoalteromonas sp. BMB]